ncbi:MAG: hypothetical protein IPN27_07460 [Cellvibrionales bacterium]|nr:hypothetical protein [Cellvibrionales bacterium]
MRQYALYHELANTRDGWFVGEERVVADSRVERALLADAARRILQLAQLAGCRGCVLDV